MDADATPTFQTTFRISVEMRNRLDELRLERARRSGKLPPTFASLVHEALTDFLRREWAQPAMWNTPAAKAGTTKRRAR